MTVNITLPYRRPE